MWLNLFKSLLKLFCGSPAQDQTGQQQPSHGHQPQYPPQGQQYSHQVQHQHPHGQQHPAAIPASGQWQHKPSSPLHGPGKHQDLNQINQSNDHYVGLRARANEHGDQMAKCFEQSHEAFARKDGALAKELSNQGKEHQRKMGDLNKQASDWIFIENNKDSKPGEVDLHGLYVKEAIVRAEQAIQTAQTSGNSQINLIVGKGLHSRGGVAKIKPAIDELIRKHNLVAQLDPNNTGVLIIHFGSRDGERGISADEISRRLERDDENCVIM
ncbi:hypothetical protein B0H34DRAFT_795892 [Crassisporium funariophilum]|nr:hypothetical protein B0H34DRAFT_795892 [Crassisporium funariophilum]